MIASENRKRRNMDGKILTLRIDWSELDLLGHVNNVAISRYFQAGRN